MSMRRPKHPGEKILLKTRPNFIPTLESAFIRFLILLILLYFFTTIISLFAVIQGRIPYLTTIPFVTYSTDVLLVIIAILFFWILWNIMTWRATWYIVTNKRVSIKEGVIRTKNMYLHFNKMQDIQVSQGLIQRISNSGDIEIFSGRDRTNMVLMNIPDPDNVENLINQRIEQDTQEYDQRRNINREDNFRN